jgi:hypothetical protein
MVLTRPMTLSTSMRCFLARIPPKLPRKRTRMERCQNGWSSQVGGLGPFWGRTLWSKEVLALNAPVTVRTRIISMGLFQFPLTRPTRLLCLLAVRRLSPLAA